jgi:hypothetical protein
MLRAWHAALSILACAQHAAAEGMLPPADSRARGKWRALQRWASNCVISMQEAWERTRTVIDRAGRGRSVLQRKAVVPRKTA